MGWNDARISLIPPGWKPVIETSESARTYLGTPVRIIHTEPIEEAGKHIPARNFRQWLRQRGFTAEPEASGSDTMRLQDIEIFSAADKETLSEAILTFALRPNSDSRVGDWDRFVACLCTEWELRLLDMRAEKTVGHKDFRRLLAENTHWKEFSAAYGWAPLPESAAGLAIAPAPQIAPAETSGYQERLP